MELKFLVQMWGGISTEPEVRWWYVCTAEEVEWKESTAVRYLTLTRPYTLECTQQALVSGNLLKIRLWVMNLSKRGVGVFSRVVIVLLKICPPHTQLV